MHTEFWQGYLLDSGHLEIYRMRWKDNIKVSLKEAAFEGRIAQYWSLPTD
jgi:hypothetical protein